MTGFAESAGGARSSRVRGKAGGGLPRFRRPRGITCTAGFAVLLALLWPAASRLRAQTLEFESGGLHYQAQTRAGLTVMVATLPTRILGYSILQVAVSNGSEATQEILPQSLTFYRPNGTSVKALAPGAVVRDVLDRAGRGDVGRLVSVYESALYGTSNQDLRNGYEARRRDALAMGGNARIRAATAAAAIVLGSRELAPGESIDGAVFVPSSNRPLGEGRIVFEAAGERFEFTVRPAPAP